MAIEVAKHYGAEIISADSRQFYREMSIGTAKPTEEQLNAVPHHFVNNLSIHQKNYSAGRYEAEVLNFLEAYFKHNPIAVMVGGSGLFINAVCSGFDKMENTENKDLWLTRNFLNTKDLDWLQQEVERLDPAYYAEVDKKNPVRLKRALEIIFTTYTPLGRLVVEIVILFPFIISFCKTFPFKLKIETVPEIASSKLITA